LEPFLERSKEKKLVEWSREANHSAYAKLLHAYSGQVFAICLAMLGNRDDAEDITQQTLLKGFTDIGQLRDDGKFGAWIGQIARNLCTDLLRGKNTEANANVRLMEQPKASSDEHPELRAALKKLPRKYRVTLMMYYFDGKSAGSVAEVLGTSELTIYTRLSRARKMLRKMLETEGDKL
jgi:RNA polymerase sigma-70 factor (ECF subfamily)